jgi:DNA-binding NarL/FixJ family response regulator
MTPAPLRAINGGMERTGDPNDAGVEQPARVPPVRVVLADDHAGFRRGLEEMLETDGGIEVVGEAEDGARAVALVREARPDVVVLDVAMPVMGGAEAMGLILREVSPPPGVVILTMHDRPRLRRELLAAGASAFLAKSASLAEIIAGVKGARPKRPPREDLGEVPPTA